MKSFSSKLFFFMAKTRRERCPHCGFLEVIKWGHQCGHQRYKCKNSGSLFTFLQKTVDIRSPKTGISVHFLDSLF